MPMSLAPTSTAAPTATAHTAHDARFRFVSLSSPRTHKAHAWMAAESRKIAGVRIEAASIASNRKEPISVANPIGLPEAMTPRAAAEAAATPAEAPPLPKDAPPWRSPLAAADAAETLADVAMTEDKAATEADEIDAAEAATAAAILALAAFADAVCARIIAAELEPIVEASCATPARYTELVNQSPPAAPRPPAAGTAPGGAPPPAAPLPLSMNSNSTFSAMLSGYPRCPYASTLGGAKIMS
jgi:hypothetical protein